MVTNHKLHGPRLSNWLLWGALILNLGVALSYVGFWTSAANQDLFWNTDFNAFYTGWSIVRTGQGARLYDIELQKQVQLQVLEGRVHKGGLLPYVNPPHMTLPFVPLAWWPRATAFHVWTLGQVGLLLWLLYLLGRLARTWTPHERRALLTGTMALPSLMLTFLISTFSLLLTICWLQFYLALKSGREERAGLWMVIGTLKPQIMLVPGLVLLVGRRWRALLSALAIGGGLVALSIGLLGWQSWTGYWQMLRTYAGLSDTFGVLPGEMYNLRGTLTLLLGNAHAALIGPLSYGALLFAAALTCWLHRGPWQPDEARFELQLAFVLLLGLLFSPHLNSHDGLLLVVPAALFYAYLRQRGLPRRAYAAFVLSCPPLFLFALFVVRDSLGIRVPVLAMVALGTWMGKALYDERLAQPRGVR